VIPPVHFNWVGPATTNDCCLRKEDRPFEVKLPLRIG
jgi:hypothetical protein